MCPCNDQNFKSVVWNIKIFCTNNFFVTVNEYCKRITLYTYKISFQLHWPSCIESESPDGISYSGSHQIEKEIFLLLTIDYLKAIEKLGHFFSCQETPTLPFFLAIAAFEWSVCCIDSFVMLNYIDIKSSIIGQLRSVGAVVMFIESNRKWCCLEPGILFYFVWQ